jgi:hypothetical protein
MRLGSRGWELELGMSVQFSVLGSRFSVRLFIHLFSCSLVLSSRFSVRLFVCSLVRLFLGSQFSVLSFRFICSLVPWFLVLGSRFSHDAGSS